jgi:replicative DNA helicase
MSLEGLTDPYAEAVTVGCAIDSPWGAQLAHSRLTIDDFHDPVLADLFGCALQLTDQIPDYQTDPWATTLVAQRVAAASHACQVQHEAVARLVAVRPVMVDVTGHYAGRVATAAHRRRVALALDSARLALEEGQEIAEAVPATLLRLLGAT